MASIASPRSRRHSVLVIDDDQMVAASIVDALAPTSDVTVAYSAEDAAQRLSSAAFDAIVCDLMMPGTSGMELYRQLLDTDPANARRMRLTRHGGANSPANLLRVG